MKRDKYDDAFSKLVRLRADWRCEHPDYGKYFPEGPARRGLHCSHVLGRAKKATRWHPLNALSLCYGHHRIVGAQPLEHRRLAREILGDEQFEELVRLSNTTKKWPAHEKAHLYKKMRSELARLEKLRAEGRQGRIDFDLGDF